MAGTPNEPTPRRVVGGHQLDGEHTSLLVLTLALLVFAGILAAAALGWLP